MHVILFGRARSSLSTNCPSRDHLKKCCKKKLYRFEVCIIGILMHIRCRKTMKMRDNGRQYNVAIRAIQGYRPQSTCSLFACNLHCEKCYDHAFCHLHEANSPEPHLAEKCFFSTFFFFVHFRLCWFSSNHVIRITLLLPQLLFRIIWISEKC